MKEKTAIIVVEIVDREVRKTVRCESISEAVSVSNRLLKEWMTLIGYADEYDSEEYLKEGWNYATESNMCAWCNCCGNWDAFIVEV